ncbi:MAG: hypothetical protein GYA21_04190 [Myxococcales bacterium]|nr:hypothetical protein [Myxococcales bacterium]
MLPIQPSLAPPAGPAGLTSPAAPTPEVDLESDLWALLGRSATAEFAALKSGVAVRSREVRQARKRQFELFREYLAAKARAGRWGFLGKLFGEPLSALWVFAALFPPATPLASPLAIGATATISAGRLGESIENRIGAGRLAGSMRASLASDEARQARTETLRLLEGAARIEQAMCRRLRELGEGAAACRRLAAGGK